MIEVIKGAYKRTDRQDTVKCSTVTAAGKNGKNFTSDRIFTEIEHISYETLKYKVLQKILLLELGLYFPVNWKKIQGPGFKTFFAPSY